jgi:hypothetical protein
MTLAVRDEVKRAGSRYSIKGRNGQPVRLGASFDIKTFSGRAVGSVQGSPPGFWSIVEEGSGKHLIAGRYQRGTRQRSGSARGRRQAFLRGDEFGRYSPLRIPGIGYRQYVIHPGHRSIGRPWRRAMDRAPEVASRAMFTETGRRLGTAWTKGVQLAA